MKVTLCERGKEQVDGKGAIEAEASKPPSLQASTLGEAKELLLVTWEKRSSSSFRAKED